MAKGSRHHHPRYARIQHERQLNASARLHLFSNASHLTPAQVLEPQGEVIGALKEGVIITFATFLAARDTRLHVSLWGMPYSERYCYRPPAIPRPEIHGTLPARVENVEKRDTCNVLRAAANSGCLFTRGKCPMRC